MTVGLIDTARVVAKLLARRSTQQDEISSLVQSVHSTLAALTAPIGTDRHTDPEAWGNQYDRAAANLAKVAPTPTRPAAARRPRRPSVRRQPLAPPAEIASEPMVPPPPKLLRRAEVVPSAPPPSAPFEMPNGTLRGVVKWFDAQARRGALRLPGHGGDVPVEPRLLDEMGITRLYKGQEVEAKLSDDATPRILRLALPGETKPLMNSGGIVHSRHAKPVVVELKREALRRVAARAEAELLLRPGRAR